MSLTVNAQTGVGGFVTPGDEVDIVLTRGGGDEMRALTILQKIRVIGVDQRSDEQSDQAIVARTVTVEVTPEQGQKLALAQSAGMLSLSLRSLETEEDKPLEAVRLSDLLVEKSPVEDGAPKAVVRVRRGATEITEQIVN
jgi:pilus assembly protein CpaB